MSVVQGKQRRAFERILDILEEKRDIREMIMDVEDRKRLLNERDELTDEYYVIFVNGEVVLSLDEKR